MRQGLEETAKSLASDAKVVVLAEIVDSIAIAVHLDLDAKVGSVVIVALVQAQTEVASIEKACPLLKLRSKRATIARA